MDIESVREIPLPPHTSAALLAARDITTGEPLERVVVWADRPHDRCPQCGQPVPVDPDVPVILNAGAGQGGQIMEVSQQHGCGYWLSVDWTEVTRRGADPTDADIADAAAELTHRRQQAIAEARQEIEARLRRDLAAALARLAEPLDAGETAEDREDEVTNGDELTPGVCYDGTEWIAWDCPPVADGHDETVVVAASDLAQATHV